MKTRAITAAALAAAAAVALAGCGSSTPAYYLASNSGLVLLIQWQAPQNGQASGTITEDQPSGSAPDETLGVTSVPVDVTINGSSVTLKPTGLDSLFGTSISGTLGSGGLTVTTPPSSSSNGLISTGTLPSSDAAAYNAAVAVLSHSISGTNGEALAQQQQAQAQASASASAQVVQQQHSADQQAASGDLSTLQTDASLTSGSLSGDLSGLSNDIGSARNDLATEHQDAAGDNGYCSATQTVAGDAQTVDGDLQTVQGDVQTIQPDISTVRQDIAKLRQDTQTLTSEGLPVPGGIAAAISTAQANLGQAIATANGYITTMNGIDSQAYSLANGMAVGACAGDGPGSPTPAIPPLS
jgi:hypothetical protein